MKPLSCQQERVWSQYERDPAAPGHHLSLIRRLRGELDIDRLRDALAQIVHRHEVLRSSISSDAQCVQPAYRFDLPVEDTDVDAMIADEATRRFDLAGGALLRARLARTPDDHVLVITAHHIASDGRSLELLRHELETLYEQRTLAPLAIQYADYAAWQRTALPAVLEANVSYWRKRLVGLRPEPFPFDVPHTSHRAKRVAVELDARLREAVDELARKRRTTQFVALVTGLRVALSTEAGADLAIGIVLPNRVRTETLDVIGCFQNVLPLFAPARPDASFAELLQQEARGTREAVARQDVPVEAILGALGLGTSPLRNPLVHVLFTHSSVEAADPGERDIVFALEVVVHPARDGGLRIELLHKSCVDESFVRGLADRYAAVLRAAVETDIRSAT